MQMRPEIQITSVIKAVKDVLIPAIDPANKLALEQSQLIIGMLTLLNSQLSVQFRFDRDELGRLLSHTEKLREIPACNTDTQAALDNLAAISAKAGAVLVGCTFDPAELVTSVRDMRAAMGSVATAAASSPDIGTQLRIEKIIVSMSKEQLLRDRSLMKMQGWESDPAKLPNIEELLTQA